MYSRAVCSRDYDRAELSAVVWTIETKVLTLFISGPDNR